ISQKSVLYRIHSRLEGAISLERLQSECHLRLKNRADDCCILARVIVVTAVNTQTATMGLEFFNIEYSQSRFPKDTADGIEREIRKVLMVNRVELVLFKHSENVRKLQGN